MAYIKQRIDDYLECAAWVNEDNYDWIPPTRKQIESDLRKFSKLCIAHGIALDEIEIDHPDLSVGHDLYLTRNRHGAGFWDRGLGETGETLTTIAHTLGETD